MRFPVFMQLFLPLIAFHMVLSAHEYAPEYHYGVEEYYIDDCCCHSNAWLLFPVAGDVSIAYDNFRSLPDGSWTGNTGGYVGANLGTELPFLSCYGFGVQLGGSYGIYDWSGRGSAAGFNDENDLQQQGFVTAGIFRKTKCCSGLNFGVVYDWMVNTNFGVFALDPEFDQIRYQAGYLFNARDEFGLWGTAALRTVQKSIDFIPVSFRGISQINLFWRHYFCSTAQTMIWVGLPYNNGLMFGSKKDGKVILGGCFKVPLNRCFSIEGHGVYMWPRDGAPEVRSLNDASNITFGLTYTFGNDRARECDDAYGAYPYMPIADNSRFISDTSLNY